MPATDTHQKAGLPHADDNSAAALEEVIETSLYTDRAHHDELGRTEESVTPNNPDEAPPSPREQPAAPIEMGRVDE